MSPSDYDAQTYFLFSAGAILLYIAAVRPSWLKFIPGMTWFNGAYPAGRLGAIVGATALLGAAAWRARLIPAWALGLIVSLFAAVAFCVAMYEMPDPGSED